MNSYELVLILKDNKDGALKEITKLVTDKEGKILKSDDWGKKNFSYPIKKSTSGFYHLIQFEAEKGMVQDFKRKLDYNEEVLRYLLLTL